MFPRGPSYIIKSWLIFRQGKSWHKFHSEREKYKITYTWLIFETTVHNQLLLVVGCWLLTCNCITLTSVPLQLQNIKIPLFVLISSRKVEAITSFRTVDFNNRSLICKKESHYQIQFCWSFPIFKWLLIASPVWLPVSACNMVDLGSISGLRRCPGEGNVGYSPWSRKESDMPELLQCSTIIFTIGEDMFL